MVSKADRHMVGGVSSTNESSHMRTTVLIEVALDALKTTQLYRAKCTHTGGTSAHLFDLSPSVVKAFQELVLNLTSIVLRLSRQLEYIFIVVAVQVYA